MINKEKQEFGLSSPASKTEKNPVLASTEQVLTAGTEPPDGTDDDPLQGNRDIDSQINKWLRRARL